MRDTPTSVTPGLLPAQVLVALDLGSNSFRMEIARFQGHRYERLDYHRRVVRLGAELDGHSRLSRHGIERALACLQDFGQALAAYPGVPVRAVATQTLREAVNRDELLERARQALGHPVEVISGHEEARLIFAGVAALQPSVRRRLVIDIGGRSTELVLGSGVTPTALASCPLGSVSLSLQCFADGRLAAAGFAQAEQAAVSAVEAVWTDFDPASWDEALGASGTVGAVAEALQGRGMTDGRITPPALDALKALALQAGHIDRIELPGISETRRAMLPGGLSILRALMGRFGLTELMPAQGALRQGVLVQLHEQLHGPLLRP